jgi:hypothetical protein
VSKWYRKGRKGTYMYSRKHRNGVRGKGELIIIKEREGEKQNDSRDGSELEK